MPTWPSASKAPTTNVDQGSDSISLARADIKQNIDNVNTIIDTFAITSPSNGDLLQYSSATGTWQPVAYSSGIQAAILTSSSYTSGSWPGISNTFEYRMNFTVSDVGGFVSYDSAGALTLAAGTYMIESGGYPYGKLEGDQQATGVVYNNTTNASLIDFSSGPELGTTGVSFYYIRPQYFTLGTTAEISVYIGSTASLPASFLIKLFKLS